MEKELLEIVDESNQVVGKAERQAIHESGLWHRGVHVFLFTPESKLLVQKRSKHRKESPSTLDCSLSEHLKPGESYSEGALRGLREELGLEPVALKHLMKYKMNYGPGDNHISGVFEGSIDGERINIDPKEIDQISYHSIPELEILLMQGEVIFCYWFSQLLSWYLGKPSEVKVLTDCAED